MSNKSGWKFIDDFDAIERALGKEMDKAATSTAASVLSKAAAKAPRKTTALAKSAFIKGGNKDNFEDAKAAALSANPDVTVEPPDRNTETPGISSVQIGFGVDYASYVHNGHMGPKGFVSPRPFMSNAMNAGDELLEENANKGLERAFKKAKTR